MKLLIPIVNFRSAPLVIDCLRSLESEIQQFPGSRVVVVDCASGDGSAEKLAAAISANNWTPWATLQIAPKNGGFAYGNNEAIRPYLDEKHNYVLLLNPDTVVRPGALRTLVEFMEANPHAGIAGSRLEDPDGTPQRSAFRFPSIRGELDNGIRLGVITSLLRSSVIAPETRNEQHPTDWVAGASMIVRPQVIADIGLMDESFFLYFEEVDYCLRARRAGWPTWYVPESHVVHLVGQSSGVTIKNERPKRRPAYWFESRRRYYVKNYGRLYALLADSAWACGYATWVVRNAITRRPNNDPPRLLRDFLANSVYCKGFRLPMD